jgi:hypothetical protein
MIGDWELLKPERGGIWGRILTLDSGEKPSKNDVIYWTSVDWIC